MSFLRHRQRPLTAVSPHQANRKYLIPARDIPTPPARANIPELIAFLEAEGWDAEAGADTLTAGGIVVAIIKINQCDFSGVPSGPLRNDLCDGLAAQGYECPPGSTCNP